MKYIRFVLLGALLISFPIFADEEIGQTESNYNVNGETTVLTQALDMSKAYNNQINNVAMRFCNDTNDLSTKIDLDFRPKQKKEICVVLENKSSEAVNVVVSVVPASLNENGNVICANNGELSGGLAVIPEPWLEQGFDLQAGEQQVNRFYMQADAEALGNYYACFTIKLSESTSLGEVSPFNLVVRKALNISALVSGKPLGFFSDFVDFINRNLKIVAIVGFSICALGFMFVVIPSKEK